MKWSLRLRLNLAFAAALLLAAIVGVTSYVTFRRQVSEALWVRHTYDVINTVEKVEKTLLDMEAGRRGFRVTNDKSFFVPYERGLTVVTPTIRDLQRLVADNSAQEQRVQQLELHVNVLLEFWKGLPSDASNYTKSQIIAIMYAENAHMRRVSAEAEQILREEYKLLKQREEKSSNLIRVASVALVAGTLLLAAVIATLIYFVYTEFSRRRKAQDALDESLTELKSLNHTSEEKNWLLSGVSEINDSLQGMTDMQELARAVLSSVCKYLQIPAAAFYVYDEQEQELVLAAGRALPPGMGTRYKLGEGLVGEAAQNTKITVVSQLPASFWKIDSAMGASHPVQLLYVPLWLKRDLKGILELASLVPFSEQQIALLNVVCRNISIAVNATDAREKVLRLLEQVQEQREVLQNQQEELRQTNEELTRQAEILQSSEEELRVQEEELRQINAELEERNEAMEMARQALALKAQELEQTGRYKSEFLANMSHELRTPLNSVLILAKLLSENKQNNLTDKQVEYAGVIHKSGSDLLKLINDILDLSKIEAGKIDFNFEQVPLSDLVSDMRQLFNVVAEEKGIRFLTEIKDDAPEQIFTDKARLEQIIKNLLSNAFKFTEREGTISLEFAPAPAGSYPATGLLGKGKVIGITVRDNGIGIALSKQQLIFEAFKQADGSTSRKYGGTGLGLSISRELVRKLGGEIGLLSEENKGAAFTIYIPVEGKAVEETPAIPSRLAGKAPLQIPEGAIAEQTRLDDDRRNLAKGDKVMLVIEDDPFFAGIVRDYAREKGYKVLVALQGEEGLLYARKYKPTAIILDMQLPVIDGWTLLKLLKADEQLKQIPVHIISAAEESRLSLGGVLAYLRKPLDREDLEGAFNLIENHLNSKVKKVLVLSGDYLHNDSLRRKIQDRDFDMRCDYVSTVEEALTAIREKEYDCVIADIGKDVNKGIEALQRVRQQSDASKTLIIVYLDNSIDSSEELRLKRVSDVIIQESSQSIDRLMDELELFLYKVQDSAPIPRPVPLASYSDDVSLKGKKVLLVDDDMRNVFALSNLLEQQQMEVVTAGDGQEALQMLDREPGIQLVLMDIMMPGMDGYEATRQIRNKPQFKNLPVIALTAKAMTGDREKSLQSGASDYITKPVDSQRLFSLMRVWLAE